MEDRGPTLTAVAVVFLVLAWIALIARGWVRVKITQRLWFDDYVLLVSLSMYNICVGMYLAAAYWGLGKHQDDPTVKSFRKSIQAWFYGDIFYTICSTLFRVAAGEHLIRHITRRSQQLTIQILTWFNILYNLYMLFVLIFQCRPVDYFWERTVVDSTVHGICQLRFARLSLHIQSATAAITDFVFATMPLWIIKRGNLAKCQKYAVISVVLTAELAGIAMILRIPYIRKMRRGNDWTWTGADVAIWSVIEPGIGIYALCLATFAPIMSYLWPASNRHPPKQYDSRGSIYRRDFVHEGALRGIPLDSGYGHIAYVETGVAQSDGSIKKKARDIPSNDTIPGAGENWDISIIKTTNVVTFLDDDVHTMTLPQRAYRQ